MKRLLDSAPLADGRASRFQVAGGTRAADDPVAVVEGIAAAVREFAGEAANDGLSDDLSVAAFYCD